MAADIANDSPSVRPPPALAKAQARTGGIMPERWQPVVAYVLAVVANLLALLVLDVCFDDIGQPALIVFLIPIILCAGIGGLWPGLAATAAAAVLSDYFLIPPQHSFEMAGALNTLRWVAMIIDGVLVSGLSEALHRARRRAEASQRLQAVTLASIGDAVLVTDAFGRVTFLNPEAERLTGWTGRAAAGATLPEVFRVLNERTRRPIEVSISDIMAGPSAAARGGEALLCTRNGREIAIEHTVSPIRGTDGRACGVVLVFRDCSERKATVAALQRKTVELQAIMAAVPAVVLVAEDRECLKVTGNRTAYEFLRLPSGSNTSLTALPEDRPGHFRVLHHGAELPADGLPVQRAARGFEVENFEEEVQFDDGTVRSLVGNATPLRGPDGEVRGAVAAFIDITARKRAEESLRKSQVQLRLLIEQAPIAIAMFDRGMNYLVTSDQWLEEYGCGLDDLVGRNYYDVFPDLPDHWRQAHLEGLAGSSVRNEDDVWMLADGTKRWLRWAVSPWTDETGTICGIIISAEDISARKRAEAEILRLNADLERRVAERTAELTGANQELDAFAYAVSHDLRAPLRALSGFSTAIEEDYGSLLTGEARLYFDQIILASHRMAELIDGLLVLSRSTRTELQRDRVDLSALAERLGAELHRSEPDRAVDWQIAPGLSAWGDPRMIEVVMRNLLDNAWKYTSRTPRPEIRVSGEPDGGAFRCCVADNGAGFDPAYARKLFRPFQRLHRQDEFPGIGIGLATVQRIIHRHGGTLSANGAVGQGATFCFTLPSAAAREDA